jgi:hypothetical protein
MYAGGGVLGGANALALTDVGGGVWEGSSLLNGSNGGTLPSSIALHMDLIGAPKKTLQVSLVLILATIMTVFLPPLRRILHFYSVLVLVKQTERVQHQRCLAT